MKKLFPIYPILIGITWVLLTYSSNQYQLPSPKEVVVPLLVTVGIITGVWFLIQHFLKNWKKSALVTSFGFLVSISHGYIRDHTDVAGIALVPITLSILAIGIYVMLKMTKESGRAILAVVANVVCIAVISVASFNIGNYQKGSEFGGYVAESIPVNTIHNPSPDVYYIIPDTYTSFYVLENYLGYDNSRFLSFLEDRGFKVIEDSYANYHYSVLSISSVLNMRYWDDSEITNEAVGRYLGSRIYSNPVTSTFKKAGYTDVHIGSWWGYTSTGREADITYRYSSVRELPFTLYKTTVWYDLAGYFDRGGNRILREASLNQFEHLVEVSKMEEPTFTMVHLILPHSPFLFNADGSYTSGWNLSPDEWEKMYLGQLEFTTIKLEETIDAILANSKVTPIIILASDEGYGGPNWYNYWESHKGVKTIISDEPDLVIMRQGDLFAILNPYGSIDQLESPVNIFRVVFNDLFDSELELLPDKYYLKSLGKYEHEFIDITEFLRWKRLN